MFHLVGLSRNVRRAQNKYVRYEHNISIVYYNIYYNNATYCVLGDQHFMLHQRFLYIFVSQNREQFTILTFCKI